MGYVLSDFETSNDIRSPLNKINELLYLKRLYSLKVYAFVMFLLNSKILAFF